MPHISHLQIVSIPVRDQDRSKDFYVGTLGFDLRRDNAMGTDRRWVEVAPPGAQTSLTLVTWFPTMPPGSLKGLVLATDDVERDYADLQQRGLSFVEPLTASPWGRWATFDDPDGNGWVLQQTSPGVGDTAPADGDD